MLIASSVIDGGTITLMILLLIAMIVACAGFIVLSFWLTSKVDGSKGLVWGALLGVGTVYFRPLLGLLMGGWGHFAFLYESLLPSAAAASTLACLINLTIWKWGSRRSTSDVVGNDEPNN